MLQSVFYKLKFCVVIIRDARMSTLLVNTEYSVYVSIFSDPPLGIWACLVYLQNPMESLVIGSLQTMRP